LYYKMYHIPIQIYYWNIFF